MGIQITPSILSADFARLGEEVARIGSADWVHVDVKATQAPVRLAREIRAAGARAAMALRPAAGPARSARPG